MPYYRYPRLRYRRRTDRRTVLAAAGAGLVLAAAVSGAHHHGHGHLIVAEAAGQPRGARVAIAWAERQLGCPYSYGGTGPCSSGFDCSGLLMDAWAQAGVTIPRTSEEQWATLRHVRKPAPGDLIFYVGSPIDPSPGHVVMYIGHGKVIQAYATGTPVERTPLSQMAAGQLIGYARP